jgi:hypothetical protein
VLSIASDPTHPLQTLALLRMDFWFDRPEHEAIKIAALSHPDPIVRENAAYVLLWDEPIAAEGPLLEATRDPVAAVAAEAANTLTYYPSRRTIRCLHGLLTHHAEKVRDEAAESFADLRASLSIALCDPDRRVADRIRRWLRPVCDLFAFTDEELCRDEDEVGPAAPREEKVLNRRPLSELLELLANPDASPVVINDQLGDTDWLAYGPAERSRLRQVLLAHVDPIVREHATSCLAVWQDVHGLLALTNDMNFGVRKLAMYHLGTLPPNALVARRAWDHLQRADALGVHATETLHTFVHHAKPQSAIPRLTTLADDLGERECLRVAAVAELTRLGAREELSRLLERLQEPPAVTWALHLALLDAVRRLTLPMPDIGHLEQIDNLHVQQAIAKMER